MGNYRRNSDLRQPVIAYFDATNNDLMLALRRGPEEWETYPDKCSFISGAWTSLDVISNGLGLGISHHDLEKNWVKFSFVNYF